MSSIAHWVERLTGDQRVIISIAIRDSEVYSSENRKLKTIKYSIYSMTVFPSHKTYLSFTWFVVIKDLDRNGLHCSHLMHSVDPKHCTELFVVVYLQIEGTLNRLTWRMRTTSQIIGYINNRCN